MSSALDLMAGEEPTDNSLTNKLTFSLANALSRRQILPRAKKAWARTYNGMVDKEADHKIHQASEHPPR